MLVLGANLGGAIPPVIASLSGPASAKRLTLGNLIVRAIGCLIALPLAGYGADLLEMLPLSPAKLPVDAHLGFNLILAALAWPFSRTLSQLMLKLVPEEARPTTDRNTSTRRNFRRLSWRSPAPPARCLASAT